MNKQRLVTNERINYILLTMVLFFSIVAVFSEGWGFWLTPNHVIQGVTVRGVDLSHTDPAEAVEKLAVVQEQFAEEEITFKIDDNIHRVTFKQLGASIDILKTVDKATGLGRQGSFWDKWKECRRIAKEGFALTPVISVDEKRIKTFIEGKSKHLERQPVDAKLVINNNDMVEIRPEKIGKKVEVEVAVKKVMQVILENADPIVEVKVTNKRPKVTANSLKEMGITGLLSAFTTYFDPGATNRAYNISLATKAFNNLYVKPGATVSYNEVVGPREARFGFKPAPVIVGDKIEQGLGGGICQVSSTLYNTVLFANLPVVERTSHSLPVSYVPAGRDATVSYGSLDFKFKNDTGKYLLIKSYVAGSAISFKIYGNVSVKI